VVVCRTEVGPRIALAPVACRLDGSGVRGEVGQVGVLVEVQSGDRFGQGRACCGVGDGHLVADLDVLDGFGGPVGHQHQGGGIEAVPATGTLRVIQAGHFCRDMGVLK